jgi:glyoxylase-like metal-dependent hydrolase (beta-lactamase superfamily II)
MAENGLVDTGAGHLLPTRGETRERKPTMANGFYRFELGRFSCVSLSDGSYDYPLESFFANVPLEQVEDALRQRDLPTDYITTPYTYLYVDTGQHHVLVDMGAGHLGPRTGQLLTSMEAASIDPAEITTVIITHAHPDHIGGTLDKDGQPVYANARFFISKDEWSFWFSETALSKTPEPFVTIARQNLEPIRDRVNLLSGESQVVPGVRVLPAPGHTPGQIVVQVSSEDAQLLYISDTVLFPLHLEHPGWLPIYDILPNEADASKHRIFDQAAESGALVMGQHFPPFPSLGHVSKIGEGWQWQPIEATR